MKKVRETDCRRLDQKSLTEMRRQAVTSVQEGQNPAAVARAMGINRTTIYDWLAMYRRGGWDALKARERGGRTARLNGKAMQWIWKTVTMKNPTQMKFAFALWTGCNSK
jgi:transposase